MCVAKTKALISCAVTAQLICVFVFAYAKNRFSHNEAHIPVVSVTMHKLAVLLSMSHTTAKPMWHLPPAKTKIRLVIHQVGSVTLLSA